MKKCAVPILLLASLSLFILGGCTPRITINYSLVSVPEEGGIKFTRITSDDDHFIGTPLHWGQVNDAWRYDVRERFSVSGDGTKIAFMASKNNKINIFIRSINGGQSVLQRTFREFTIDPCLSPDGKRLAFSEYRNGAWNIFETSAEGGTAIRQITSDNYSNVFPQYAPDQSEIMYTQIAYSTYTNGATIETITHSSLWSYTLNNAQVTQYGEGFTPSYCADKSKVVVTRYNTQAGTTELWLLDLVKGAETIIFSQKKRGALEPAVSPTGDMVAFVSLTEASTVPANLDIYLINIDGSNLTQLTFHDCGDISPRWMPDGKSLLIASRRGTVKGEWNIWKMDLPEGFLRGEKTIAAPTQPVETPTQPVAAPTQPVAVMPVGTPPPAPSAVATPAVIPAPAPTTGSTAAVATAKNPALDSTARGSVYEALKGMDVVIMTSEGKELRGRLLDANKETIKIDFFGTPLTLPMAKIKAISVGQ
jgi:hypothetical protein